MKNSEIINSMRVGDICGKQILAAMKKKGLIYDYSPWGYLEGVWCGYKEDENYTYRNLYETFPHGNAPKEGVDIIFENENDFRNLNCGGNITYMGCRFSTKYLSGCFKPYLELVEKYGNREKEVNYSMSLWGGLM